MSRCVVGFHRQERPGADMERDLVHGDATLRELLGQLRSEMQPRGRRRDRSFVMREHGLIVGVVLRIGWTPRRDIGRQRHVAAFLDRLVEHRPVEREGERDFAAVALLLDGGVELAEEADPALLAEPHDVARRETLCRLHKGAPARAVKTAM